MAIELPGPPPQAQTPDSTHEITNPSIPPMKKREFFAMMVAIGLAASSTKFTSEELAQRAVSIAEHLVEALDVAGYSVENDYS